MLENLEDCVGTCMGFSYTKEGMLVEYSVSSGPIKVLACPVIYGERGEKLVPSS